MRSSALRSEPCLQTVVESPFYFDHDIGPLFEARSVSANQVRRKEETRYMSFWKKLFGGSPAPAVKPPQPKPATLEPPKTAAPAQPTNVVEEAKALIRNSRGARDFHSRATQAGWSKIKEDFIGIYLKKGDATLIFGVLPSHGPDTIWNAMMTTTDTGTVYLISEGNIVI
jgi:hypothetical protein